MSTVPENRTTNNSAAEHISDHNELARLHNIFDGVTPILTARSSLSAAQLSNLHGTPIQLAAAPGAGKGYKVLSFVFIYHFVSAGYTSANGRIAVGPLAAVINDYSPWETDPAGVDITSAPLGQTSGNSESVSGNTYVEIRQTSQMNKTPPEYIDNQPLVIGNSGDELVGGDGTINAVVQYVTITL